MDNYRIYKYINEKSILVITPKNGLKKLYCPFPVLDKTNKLYNVMSIATGDDFKIYYMINGQYELYSDYKIQPQFWGEINESQELIYPAIMCAIISTGYKGYVAQEFVPKNSNKLASLKKTFHICDI